MKPEETLETMCDTLKAIYDILKKALGETRITWEELREKVKVLEDNGTVSKIFFQTIGLDDGVGIIIDGKKVECYGNCCYYARVPKIVRSYIDKGYMRRKEEDDIEQYLCFAVTEEGFAWLSKLLGITVEEVCNLTEQQQRKEREEIYQAYLEKFGETRKKKGQK